MIRQPLQTLYSDALTTASGNSVHTLGVFDVNSLVFQLSGNIAGTSPTMDVYVQTSTDGGTTFFDCGHFAQVTANLASPLFLTVPVNGGDGKYVGAAAAASIAASTVNGLPILGKTVRIQWVAGGTVTSTTLTVSTIANNQSTGAGA